MGMICCEEDVHYYDSDKYLKCPYCEEINSVHSGHESNSTFDTMAKWTKLPDNEAYITEKRTEVNSEIDSSSREEVTQMVGLKMVSCVNGHFYDKEKHRNSCPYCQYTSKLSVGDRFDKYVIKKKMSSSRYSDIYLVKHKYLNHEYVLKIFNDDGFKDLSKLGEVRELFLDEARRLAPLNHANIVKIFDAGTFNDNAYILLEYINATRLDELMARIQRFEVNKVFDLLEDMARAFMRQEIHGIVHSAIKPQNIFLRANNTFCLIDYGNIQDKITKPSTQAYYAPEYFKGQSTNQSDLFSLGMVVWQCLTGERPKGVLGWQMNIPSLESYRVDVPKELIKIMNNLLAIETATRYKTAKELLEDIECYRYRDEEPLGTVLGSAFIAISFSDKFVDVYKVLNNAIRRVNFKSIRMDKLHFQDEIWKNIALEIENSDVMIADFSETSTSCGPNANVLTEAAHARAIGKDIIVITRDRPEDVPFDWRYVPIITYIESSEGLEELSEKIYSKLRIIYSNKAT